MAMSFVRKAPSRASPGAFVPVRVSSMTTGDAAWWDARVQPRLVNRVDRADRFWSWLVMLPMAHLFQASQGRPCTPLVIWAYTPQNTLVRAAMAILVERFPRLDVQNGGEAVFTWFISAAPGDVLGIFGVTDPPSLGKILVDLGIVLSMNDGNYGRIGLHADPAGGLRLNAFYGGQCGLLNLPSAATLPRPLRRNDGRYFYTDDAVGGALLAMLQPWR